MCIPKATPMTIPFRTTFFAAAFAVLASPTFAVSSSNTVVLLMGEEPGCVWCARWNEEIAPIYPKTDEGKSAPLVRFDITEEIPTDVTFSRPVSITPTFIVLVDGVEQTRLEGYPGEDFFWGILGQMLTDAGVDY